MKNASTASSRRRAFSTVTSSYYDAASSTPEQAWGASLPSWFEDAHFSPVVRAITIGRLRREIRNNPYLAGLVNKFPEAVGFSNLRSRASDPDYNAAKDLFWFRWMKSVTVAGDSLRMVEEIILRELLVAGEIFIVLLANGRIQLIPSEFCGSGVSAGAREIAGIVYDANWRPIAYRFGRLGKNGTIDYSEPALVPARDIIHVYHKDRVMMGRGLPWLLASLRPARDLYEITRAKTDQIKKANLVSGSIEKEGARQFLQGYSRPGDGAAAETPASPADPQEDEIIVELKPGTFVPLEPGEKLNMLKVEYQATDYKELIMLMLHSISTPIGLPVELWFSGIGEVNFSGFKGLGAQWKARRTYICAFLEDRYLNRLHFWRISKARNEGDIIDVVTGAEVANPDRDEDLISWAWRRVVVLDDEREARTNKVLLETGEASLADIWEEKGLWPEEVLEARRQWWIKILKAAGRIEPQDAGDDVQAPIEFLLWNRLPGMAASGASSPSTETQPAEPPPGQPSAQPQETEPTT